MVARGRHDAVNVLSRYLPFSHWPHSALFGAALRERWAPFRFALGPWRWMIVVYVLSSTPITTRSSGPVFSIVWRGVGGEYTTRGRTNAGSDRRLDILAPDSSRRTKLERGTKEV